MEIRSKRSGAGGEREGRKWALSGLGASTNVSLAPGGTRAKAGPGKGGAAVIT